MHVSVPLRGVGCFLYYERLELSNKEFPSPCGVWVVSRMQRLQGKMAGFPSPCGVWVVSSGCKLRHGPSGVSVPLRGVGCFQTLTDEQKAQAFPSPCGVWVVSPAAPPDASANIRVSVPLRGVGCFQDGGNCHGGPGVSVPLRGVGCFGKAAHSFWCNRKKNCQLCCFIVSYWQMFINSKLRNCKVPCEAHKTAT